MTKGLPSPTAVLARSRLKSSWLFVKIGVSGELTYFASWDGSSWGVSAVCLAVKATTRPWWSRMGIMSRPRKRGLRPPTVIMASSRMKKSPHWRSASSEYFLFWMAAPRPPPSGPAAPILKSSATSGVNRRSAQYARMKSPAAPAALNESWKCCAAWSWRS